MQMPLYACIIDGKEQDITAIDYAYLLLQGHKGSMGGFCGYKELEPANGDELAAAFAELERAYN